MIYIILISAALTTFVPFVLMVIKRDNILKNKLSFWVCALITYKLFVEIVFGALLFCRVPNWSFIHSTLPIFYIIYSSILLYNLSKRFKIFTLTLVEILTGLHIAAILTNPLNSTPIICGGLIMFSLGICSIAKPNRPIVIMWITKGVVIYFGVACLMWLKILNPESYIVAGLLNAISNIIANYYNLRGVWILTQR